ncbi:MAG TPA: hypothetical protein PLE99_10180 [Candidatus Thiothrix moscowensis]|uniref:hypothetical protein n=1 Tax=Thiothrix sp. UBA2016 TaxID=1947695 RepID=UPI0025FF1C30|nr:hypothetical protein [Thiothrix sp. UBA2016]HRJ53127.1 hypothetical protein [Candidatus Thiothrix moscowensis]HRJ93118.1 hypothetical protein [Candidatus Thiothrix moscowensis]
MNHPNFNDRLYDLLPAIYRIRDKEQGEPLRALLGVISGQVGIVEQNITQLYDNWFIETCEDWVIPYLAELVGHHSAHNLLPPRQEVANTIRYRRSKGTLALLESLANDTAGWPARVVEFYQLLGQTQHLGAIQPMRGRRLDVRDKQTLANRGNAFDSAAYTVDVRRASSSHRPGRYNVPNIGLFVWRLQAFPVNCAPAYCVEAGDAQYFTFSALGNDTQLLMNPVAETDPMHIADAFNLPVAIDPTLLKEDIDQAHKACNPNYPSRIYGKDKSLYLWKGSKSGKSSFSIEPVPITSLKLVDLSGWRYRPAKGEVALDLKLGRIAFPQRPAVANGVWVSYQHGFSALMGGGEYEQPPDPTSPAAEVKVYRIASAPQEKQDNEKPVKSGKPRQSKATADSQVFATLKEALTQWEQDMPAHAVIEIADNRVYAEPGVRVDFNHFTDDETEQQPGKPAPDARKSLCIRAANGYRPVIRLLDWQSSQPDALLIIGSKASRFSLEGVLVAGRGIQLDGDLQQVNIRHTTLVPGWELGSHCEPKRPLEPSLEIFSPRICVNINHSIVGTIHINPQLPESDDSREKQALCQGIGKEQRLDPIRLCIADSIVDATADTIEAIGAPGCPVAHAILDIQRCTVIGETQVHAITEANNSIFTGKVDVARRQIGCMRFCYVPGESRIPKHYHCQPPRPLSAETAIRPQFNSTRYGEPAYCQLADASPTAIREGADDQSEMGVFHDLFLPQREISLRLRLEEYIPAGADVGIIKVN